MYVYSTGYFRQSLMKIEFVWLFSESSHILSSMKIPPIGGSTEFSTRTDTQEEAKSRFSQFCDGASNIKKYFY
jgi:hypothetical protein